MATDAELMAFRIDLIAHFTDRIKDIKKRDKDNTEYIFVAHQFGEYDDGWNEALDTVLELLNPKDPHAKA